MPISNNEANVEELAGHLTVFQPDGTEVRLGAMWSDRVVVLALVRHFGCIFCKEQVSQLREIVTEVHSLGAELVIVGTRPKQRGLSAYPALQSRIEDEVRDAHYVNPMVSLVRLSMASTPAPPQTDAGHLRTASPPSATPLDPSPAWNRGITS